MIKPRQNKQVMDWRMACILLIEYDSTVAEGLILGLKIHGTMVD